MAQLRHDYAQFTRRGAEVIVIGPDDEAAFRAFWQKHELPMIGLADPEHRVADQYGQRVRVLKFGRLPTVIIVDREGRMLFRHDGSGMHDIPPNSKLLARLDTLNERADPPE